jgi:tellurite resistance protein TehA-like permease
MIFINLLAAIYLAKYAIEQFEDSVDFIPFMVNVFFAMCLAIVLFFAAIYEYSVLAGIPMN